MSAGAQAESRFDPKHPFTRGEAFAAGIGISELLGRRYQRVFHGLYVTSSIKATPLVRSTAGLRVMGEGAHVSHDTAVMLWGGVAPDTTQTHLSVLPGRGVRSLRQGIKAHLAHPDSAVVQHRGVRISTPQQAFLDLAASGVRLVDLVIAGDSLVTSARVAPSSLIEAAGAWLGRGARLARRAAALVREGVDSPMETRLRLLIVFAGLPEPKVNVIVRQPDGHWKMRFDLCYLEYKLIIEYDGRQHADNAQQWEHDIERREDLDRMGLRIIIVTSAGIYLEPERTLQRIRAALQERRATGLPKRFKAEWSRHFQARS